MVKILPAEFNGQAVQFNSDGWFNATLAAEKYGKRPVDWLSLESTDAYISRLSANLNCEKSSLLKVSRGKYGGTWMHPKLAVRFARWLDVDFELWCDSQIENIIRDDQKSNKVLNEVLKLARLEAGKETQHFHYANEAKLVNFTLSGKYEGLDRDQMSCPIWICWQSLKTKTP